jgi:hypothetical protein
MMTLIWDEDQQHLHHKLRTFHLEVHMDNPTFRVGMVFSDVKEVRNAMLEED